MYCPHCGSQVPDTASICPACGVPLGNPYQSSMAGPGPVYPGPNVPSYLVPAIFTTVLCCMPFGIVAIVYAAQVGSKLAAGDFEGRRQLLRFGEDVVLDFGGRAVGWHCALGRGGPCIRIKRTVAFRRSRLQRCRGGSRPFWRQ